MEGVQDIVNYTLIVVGVGGYAVALFAIGFIFARHFRK